MELAIILLIFGGILIISFASQYFSKTTRIATKIITFLIALLLILTLLVSYDVNQLKKGFIEKHNTFLFFDNETLYAGVTLKPLKNNSLTLESFNYFSEEEILKMQENIKDRNFDYLLENSDKIFIVNKELLSKPYSLDLGTKLNQDQLLNLIMVDKPFIVLANLTKDVYGVEEELLVQGYKELYKNSEQLKGYLLAALISNYFQKQSAGDLRNNIKDKSLFVYPESLTFNIIKYLPNFG